MVAGTWALNCLSGASLPGRTMLGKGLPSKTSDAPHVKWEQSHSSEVTVSVRESAQKPWHMHSRLSHGFVTTESTVLFTAPPASAWQQCLPVLYLIPPAKLALNISLLTPRPAGRGDPCAHLSGLGLAALVAPRVSWVGGGLEPTPGAIPGSWGWCLSHPQRLHSRMAHCSPLLVAVSSEFSPRLPAAGRGWDGVVLASQMELVSVILRPNGSPKLCFSGGGGDWQELGGAFHPLPLPRAQHTWLFSR